MSFEESDSLTRLREASEEAARECRRFRAEHRFGLVYVFGMTRALRLAGVEIPRIDLSAHPRLSEQRMQLVVRNKNLEPRVRAQDANHMLAVYVWDAPMDFACLGDDLIFTSPICTWAMLARFLSLEELIVLGDSILRRNTVHRQYSQADFKNYLIALRAVKGRRAPRGIVKCERALTLMRPGTDSSRETKLRLCIVQHGLPMPMINHRIRAINGNVYYLDLAYPDATIAIEYDGMFHSGQWLHDSDRRNAIEASGWVFIQVTKTSLSDHSHRLMLVRRIAHELEMRTGIHYFVDAQTPLAELVKRR